MENSVFDGLCSAWNFRAVFEVDGEVEGVDIGKDIDEISNQICFPLNLVIVVFKPAVRDRQMCLEPQLLGIGSMLPFYFTSGVFVFEDDDLTVEGGESEVYDGAALILFLGEG